MEIAVPLIGTAISYYISICKKHKLMPVVIIFKALTHLIFGFLFGSVAQAIVPIPEGIFLALLGSLLPDIDHPKSHLGRYIPLINLLCQHRGKCHTVIGCALLSIPFSAFSQQAFFFVFTGSLSHLTADFLAGKLPRRRAFKIRWW